MGAYLDNAATSWPKPEAVYQAVDHFMREVGATPGRAGHWREEEARRIADEARAALARLFHAPAPQGVAFTMIGAGMAKRRIEKTLIVLDEHEVRHVVQLDRRNDPEEILRFVREVIAERVEAALRMRCG
jgi:cysteine sulfinate desulfinase/cysteine desulfurase-like protein